MKQFQTFAASVIVFLMAVCVSVPAMGQKRDTRDYETFPHWYVSLQGGAQSNLCGYDISKLATPVGAVAVGYNFSPVVGARVGVHGWQSKGGDDLLPDTYKYKYITGNVDVLFNMSNLITGRDYSVFNVILLGGVGFNHAWDYELPAVHPGVGMIQSTKNSSHNFRMGLQLDFDLGKTVGLNIEAGVNNLNDNYNALIGKRSDWQAYAMAGLSFKFGHTKRAKISDLESALANDDYSNTSASGETAAATVKEPTKSVEPAKVVTPAQPVSTPTVQKQETSIFFAIGKSQAASAEQAKLDEVVEFLNKNPKAKLRLTGYADKGTGTAQINRRLSEQRVKYVQDLLAKRGIDASRISIDFKGDTVQPYAENDQNRVVIGIAE